MPLLRVWQALFALSLLATLIFAQRIAADIQIDTNLADISPANQHSPQTQEAITALRENIEQRMILLVSGDDEDRVYEAETALRTRLLRIANIDVLPSNEDVAQDMLDALKPYRFSLLTPAQQDRLRRQSANAIAQKAYADLSRAAGQARVYAFQDDPLGWHSETLLSFIDQGGAESSSEQHTLPINLSMREGALNMRAQQLLSEELALISKDIKANYAVTVDQSGIFFFAADAAKNSKADISLISTGSTVGVVLLLLFVFRSFRALILPLISIALGVGFALVVTHLIYGKVHVLTIVFGASLIGIVIDYSLHYFYHGGSRESANSDEKHALFRALTLSLMTSIIGYAALGFSDLQALQKVALFSCCGLLMAWLSVICLGDLAIKRPLTTEQKLFPSLVAALSNSVARLPNSAWAGIAIGVMISGAVVAGVVKPFNDDPRLFFNTPSHLLESEQRVAAVTSDFEPGRYIIINGQSQNEIYQRHQVLMDNIAMTNDLAPESFTSLLSWVPSPSDQTLNYSQQATLYGQHGAVARLYKALGNDQGFEDIQNDYLNAASTRLSLDKISSIIGASLPPLLFQAEQNVVSFVLVSKGVDTQELESHLKSVDGVEYVNTLERTESALAEQRSSATRLLLLAYALVAILMMVRFRSVRAIWLVCVPVCATAMLFLISYAGGFALNLFHVMALFLVLGFGMDYTIFTHEMRAHASITLQAILLSALTSLLSFGLLGLSAIPIVASFGITLLLGNFFNLLGAFVYARTQTDP